MSARTRTCRAPWKALSGLSGLWLSLPLLYLLGGCWPMINDISTDLQNAPVYFVAPPQEGRYHTAKLSAPTRAAYPDLENLVLPVPVPVAFAAVRNVARSQGWEIVQEVFPTADEPGRLQAVATTLLLRFKDDVIVEVRQPAQATGTPSSEVAVRSKSRIGLNDLGTNARRIRRFLAELRAAF